MMSAIDGNTGIAIGNVVGSNIFNTLIIIGAVAVARPIKITGGIMSNEIPLVVLSAGALLAMGSSKWLDGTTPVISRVDGILLLLFFAIFMRYVFSQSKQKMPETSENSNETKPVQTALWKSVIFIIGGLAALIYGGDLFVDKASAIASSLGVSDAIIGLTIVAMGTSLPELATSLTAAIKGNSGIAIGNVIGSNIFNIFLVLGCSATIQPLPFGAISEIDLLVLFASCVLFWIFGWFFGNRTINRAEGGLLVAGYIAYMIYLVADASM